MDLLSDKRRQWLKRVRVKLMETIQLNALVWAHLRQYGVVTQIEQEKMQKEPNSCQVGWLIDSILGRTNSDYDKTCQALELSNQKHVAQILQNPEGVLLDDWRNLLAEHYIDHYGRMRVNTHGDDEREAPIDELYTDTCLTIHDATPSEPVETKLLSFLSKANGNLICIKGPPGSGKSTLVKRCLVLWSKSVQESNAVETMYDLVLCTCVDTMEKGKDFTIKDILCERFNSDTEEVLKFMEANPDRVLIIFDGIHLLDQTRSKEITSIIHGHTLRGVSKIVTARDIWPTNEIDRRVTRDYTVMELHGFNKQQCSTFIGKYFRPTIAGTVNMPNPDEEVKLGELLDAELESRKLKDLYQLPIHLNLACQLWHTERKIFPRRTDLYAAELQIMLDQDHHVRFRPIQLSLENLNRYGAHVISFGIRVFMQLIDLSKISGSEERDEVLRFGAKLGLFEESQEHGIGRQVIYLNIPMIRFLAAYAIVHVEGYFNRFMSHVQTTECLHNFHEVVLFVCGLSEACGNRILAHAIHLSCYDAKGVSSSKFPHFLPKGGNVWKARLRSSRNISFFISRCLREFNNKTLINLPLPDRLTIDLGDLDNSLIAWFRSQAGQSAGVQHITINNGRLSQMVWKSISAAINLTEVRNVYLELDAIEDVKDLAHSIREMTRLSSLQYHVPDVTEEQTTDLVQSITEPKRFMRFNVSHLKLNQCADIYWRKVAQMDRLVRLSVRSVDLSYLGENVSSLANSACLTQLVLEDTNLSDSQVHALCHGLVRTSKNPLLPAVPSPNKTLVWLDLSKNDLRRSINVFSKTLPKLSCLKMLHVNYCRITEDCFKDIVLNSPSSLLALHVAHNRIQTAHWMASSPVPLPEKLRFVLCKENPMSDHQVQQMERAWKMFLPNITFLYNETTLSDYQDKLRRCHTEIIRSDIQGMLKKEDARKKDEDFT